MILKRDLFRNGKVDFVCQACMVIVKTPDHCQRCNDKGEKAAEAKRAFFEECKAKREEEKQVTDQAKGESNHGA